MAYTNTNFATKKELKQALDQGRDIRCHNPGIGPDLGNFTGKLCLEGPHYPRAHSWYAEAELVDGKVVRVK